MITDHRKFTTNLSSLRSVQFPFLPLESIQSLSLTVRCVQERYLSKFWQQNLSTDGDGGSAGPRWFAYAIGSRHSSISISTKQEWYWMIDSVVGARRLPDCLSVIPWLTKGNHATWPAYSFVWDLYILISNSKTRIGSDVCIAYDATCCRHVTVAGSVQIAERFEPNTVWGGAI